MNLVASEQDLLTGLPLARTWAAATLPAVRESMSSWSALEEAVLPALQRPPCVVAFSGGRDSSLLLAVAAASAHRHGLPAPIAVTNTFDVPDAEESYWQESVIRFLGVKEWVKIHLTNELDFLGTMARSMLRRHGVRFPANVHSMVPVAERAVGGSLITGVGGDELFGSWRWRWRSAFLGGTYRYHRAWTNMALGAMPLRIRRRVVARQVVGRFHRGGYGRLYLTARGAEVVVPLLVGDADHPVKWERFVAWLAGRRVTGQMRGVLEELGADFDVQVHTPFFHPMFLAALARHGRDRGFQSRTRAMRAIAGDKLPQEVITRRSKAFFHDVFWGPQARSFAQAWDGQDVDASLIDPHALRSEWLSPVPDFSSTLLLHHAWLCADRRANRAPAVR